MALARLAWVTRPWISLPRIAAHTAGLLAAPKATERTNGIRSSAEAGATIMRLSSGVATGLPSAPMNTPASSACTPRAARASRSRG